MYKELNSIAIFVAVVEAGGFSKAAEKVGLSNSVISHHVTKLEESLGATLLYRSTRQLTLSDKGQDFYTVAASSIKSIEEATTDIRSDGKDPSGQLNIAMPAFVPDPRLQQLIWEFTSLYPNVDLKVSFSDDQKKLIQDGFDIAFRLGNLESSGIFSRKIVDVELKLVGSPEFLSKAKKISQPMDIKGLDCISLSQLRWNITLLKGNVTEEVPVSNKRIIVDNIYAARDAAVAGIGLIPLPIGLCEQEIADGKLVHILPEWSITTIPLHAVWNNKARRNSLTRRLLSFLSDNY